MFCRLAYIGFTQSSYFRISQTLLHLLIPDHMIAGARTINLSHVTIRSQSFSPFCWPAQWRCAIENNDNNKNAVREPSSACTDGKTTTLHVSQSTLICSIESIHIFLTVGRNGISDQLLFLSRYLKEFRTQQCPLFLQHKCTQHRPFTCFHWHFMNQRRRRPVRKRDGTFNYSPDIYCTKFDETTGICPDGDE